VKQDAWRWDGNSFEPTTLRPWERAAVEGEASLCGAPSLLILPPLWDHHGHLTWLGATRETVDLRGAASPEEALGRVRDFVRDLPAGAWAEGFGWDQNLWGGALPDLDALEEACTGRPAYLRRIDTHAAWVNRAALSQVGIPPDAHDPPGGAYLRKGSAFTGVVMDRAMEPFEAHVARSASLRTGHRILAGLEMLRCHGLCGTTDMNLDGLSLKALMDFDPEGALPLPVDGFLSPGVEFPVEGVASTVARFRVVGRKIFLDGALGSRGAALVDGYCDDPENRGLLVETEEGVLGHLEESREREWVLAAHVIGDRALSVLLDAAEAFGKRVSLRLEHLQVVGEEDMARLVSLKPVASLQPCHLLSDAPWAPGRLGERMATAYRLRSLDAVCSKLLLGTDYPIEPPDPRRTLYACITRGGEESIPLGRALEGMAPPEGRVAGGAFTLAAGEPWAPGLPAERVLEWELHAVPAPLGGEA
jgi:predicted amidohydrolase YtcJ